MIPSLSTIQGGNPTLSFVLLALIYLFFAFCLVTIAKKAGQEQRAWWGWVPIMQVLLLLKIASLDWWWIFFFLIPFVNVALAIFVWVKIAKVLSKHPIWGVLMIVPVVDVAVLAYLAFSKRA